MARKRSKKGVVRPDVKRRPLSLEALESRILLTLPVVTSLTDVPDPVHQGDTLTLTANSVYDTDGQPITSVQFYRSTDNVLNLGSDTLLGADVSPVGGWTWSGPATWASGTWYYFATATAGGETTLPANAAMNPGYVNAKPTIASLTGSPEPTGPGRNLTLTANGVADANGTVSWVDFYRDSNNNGVYDVSDTYLGRDSDGLNGWTRTVLVQWTTGDYFARARDNNGGFSAYRKGHVDQMPVIGAVQNSPNPVLRNQWVTFTATGVTDSDGTVSAVDFYRDVYDSGNYNPAQDQLLGHGISMGGGIWALTVFANWEPDISPIYFAIAQDNEGFMGQPVWTLNQNPSIEGVEADPSPVNLGDLLSLTAVGVQDSDGYVQDVVFSVTAPPEWWPYEDMPTDWQVDPNGPSEGDDWRWQNLDIDWNITDIVQADFNQDGFMDLAVTVDVASTAGPDFVSVLTNDGIGQFVTTSMITLYGGGANYNPTALATGDFDEDDYPDIAVADFGQNHISVLLNDGAGMFTGYTDYSANFTGDRYSLHPDQIAVGDYTGDGHVDIVAYSSSEHEMPVWFGDGTGTFVLNRIYSVGSSRWVDGNEGYGLLPGEVTPPSALAPQDMVSADFDEHEDGGPDLALVGLEGPQFFFNYLRGLDPAEPIADDWDIFDAGNVIGRAWETGIAGEVPMFVGYGLTYRTGNTWDFGWWDRSRTDDFNHLWIAEGDVDMFRVELEAGQNVYGLMTPIPPPGDDDPGQFYAYVYNSSGGAVYEEDTGLNVINYTASAPGVYYLAVSGVDLITDTDSVDPFDGHWGLTGELPDGGTDREYWLDIQTSWTTDVYTPADILLAGPPVVPGTLGIVGNLYHFDANSDRVWTPLEPVWADDGDGIFQVATDTVVFDPLAILADGMPGSQGAVFFSDAVPNGVWDGGESVWAAVWNTWEPLGSGDSLAFGDFMEDDYNNNAGLISGTNDLRDVDMAVANSDTDEVAVFKADRWQNPNGVAYGGFFAANEDPLTAPYGLGGLSPTAIAVYNIDSDTNRDTDGEPDWDWAQGSTGEFGDGTEIYNDIVVTNSDGSMTALINDGEHSGSFGIHEFDYTAYFGDAALNYELDNSTGFGGPFQGPVGIVAGDFNGDGLASLIVAEQYNVGVLREAYSSFYSDPKDLNLYTSELAQVGLPFDFAGRFSVVAPEANQRTVTYYATAFDEDYGYPYNLQYEGYSAPVSLDVVLNQKPVIWTVTANREALSVSDDVTLTANFAQDMDGYVAAVEFYLYVAPGDLDPTTDLLLGTDLDGSDGWTWTDDLLGANDIFYALAIDNDGAAGAPAATHVNVAPTIADLFVDNLYYAVDDALIAGVAPADGTLGIRGANIPFFDRNVNNIWDQGEEVWDDGSDGGDPNGVYDEESLIYDGGNAVWNTPVTTAGLSGIVLFGDKNFNGRFDWNEGVWVDADNSDTFNTGETVLWDGGGEWLAPDGDAGIAGNVYLSDLDASTTFTAGDEVWADAALATADTAGVYDGIQENHVYDGGDGWQTRDAAIGITGNVLFDDVDTGGDWNGVEGIWADEVKQQASLTLTAVDVDLGAHASTHIEKVHFYRDSDYNGVFDPDTDIFLGRGTNAGNVYGGAADEWQLLIANVDWSPGAQKYFAVAQDSADNWSAEVSARDKVVNLAPRISGLTDSPDPVTQGQAITLTGNGVEDPYGQVHSVSFFLDMNGNSTIEPATDLLLGVDESPVGGWRWSGPATWAGGLHTYMARVTDNYGAYSDATTTGWVNLPPVIASMTDSPDPVNQGQTLTLHALGVADQDAGTVGPVQFFRDSNDNGALDVGVDDQLDQVFVTNLGGGDWRWQGPASWPVGDQLYFARARDNDLGWSVAAGTVGRVANAVPTIGSVTLAPNPVTQGYNLVIAAHNVVDPNGSIVKVEFYRDSDHNGSLFTGSDTLLGTVTFAEGTDYPLTVNVTWETGLQTYFVRAQDNEGLWSETAFVSGLVNGRPVVTALTPTPTVLVPGDTLNLTATGVSDPDGTVAQVAFYRDGNGDGIFQADLDTLIGTDASAAGGWTFSLAESSAVRTFFARAQDNDGGWSFAASATVQRRPTIGGLTDFPDPVTAAQTLVLTATTVQDIDGMVDFVQFYRDANGNSALDPGVDQLLGLDTIGADGWSLSVSPTWGGGTHRFFARARDNEGNYSLDAYAPTTTTYVDYSPVIAAMTALPNPVTRGDNLALEATGVSDADGAVLEVEFYRDENANGILDLGVDMFLGRDTLVAGGWNLVVPTAGWSLGTHRFFARGRDNLNAWSNVVTTTSRVNGQPVVAALQDSPDPVLYGDSLTLTAVGVADLDGTVAQVRFYRDSNGSGTWDPADLLLGTDTDGSNGWTAVVNTTGMAVTTHTYFARAFDNDGAASAPASTTNEITTAPDLLMVMQAASDTGVSSTDGITSDNTPTFDFSVNYAGTIDIDWNGDTVVDHVVVAGSAGVYTRTAPAYADGPYTVKAEFIDFAANTSTDEMDIVIDTASPAAPGAPDLQAASDNGLSSVDNVTSILTPTFDVVPGTPYFRFYRDGGLISGNYESGSSYTTGAQSLGTYGFRIRAVDAAGNQSGLSPVLNVTFVSAPATPAAPDLQAGSDSGLSNTDNNTNAGTLVFDVSYSGVSFRLWRDGVLVTGVPQTGSSYAAGSEPEGTHQYTVTTLDALDHESAHSAPLTAVVDRTAPTVTDANIDAVISVDGARPGIVDNGDVITVTWDTSVAGDNNADVAGVVVDLSDFGEAVPAAMFDDGTHGDATAGDRIWTLNYTVGPGDAGAGPLNVAVTATDIAGNSATGQDTSNLGVEPLLLALRSWPGFMVAIYDVDGNSDFDPANAVITVGPNNTVKTIAINGNGSGEGLGISISGATSVGQIKDNRTGALGQLAFIASDSSIASIILKSGIAGYDLNGATFGGLTFATDVDGDGLTNDKTAVYTEGWVTSIQTGGPVNGDVLIGGANAGGVALGSFVTKVGGFHGDLDAQGGVGTINLAGSFASSMSIMGNLTSFQIKGGDFAGDLDVTGNAGKVIITGGDFSGMVDVQGNLSEFSVKRSGSVGGWLRAGSNVYARGLVGLTKLTAFNNETANGGEEFGIFASHVGSIQVHGQTLHEADLPYHQGDFSVELLP